MEPKRFLLFCSLESGLNHTKPLHIVTQCFKTHFNIALQFALGLPYGLFHSRLPTIISSCVPHVRSGPCHYSCFHYRVNRPVCLIMKFYIAILVISKPWSIHTGTFRKLKSFRRCCLYVCNSWLFNLLNPTGYLMHQQFNIQLLYVMPTLYLCVLYLSENKQRLVPLTA